MRTPILRALAGALLLVLAPLAARAQNALVNPGAETGSVSPWTFTQVYPFLGSGLDGGNCTGRMGSVHCFAIGTQDAGTLGFAEWTQTFSVTPGEAYRGGFNFVMVGAGSQLEVLFSLGGQTASPTCPVSGITTTRCRVEIQWIAAAPTATFTVRVQRTTPGTNLGGVLWDDAYALPASVVPEPSTYALLGTGLLALGGVARRRRAA